MLKKKIKSFFVLITVTLLILLSVFSVSALESVKWDLGSSIISLNSATCDYAGYILTPDFYETETPEQVLVAYSIKSSAYVDYIVSEAEFTFSGYNYGQLKIIVEAGTGTPHPYAQYYNCIMSDGNIISNYSLEINNNQYIFTINGNIPSKFTLKCTFGEVTPQYVVEDVYSLYYYMDSSSFIPDYNNINQGVIDNQNQNTDEIVSNQNQNTQDIINNQNQLQQNEKDEADSSGNDGVNSIVGGIENKGEGFFNSMGNLISVMSYNGTDCKWNLPPITLPKINGVMDSITLTDNLEIDFEYWISQIPTTIMRVVQAILTIALILFCVKELYSVLSYVFTLRGG